MPNTIKDIERSIIDTAAGSFEAFCEDISGMFGISAEGSAEDRQLVTLKDLKSDFKKITAVFIVEGKGVVNGSFYVILDQDALFTLAGTFVMLPEKVIIQNRKMGKEKEANEISDAVGEVGNLLVGAWDRYFREELEDHVHLLQTGTFIGKPWLKPEENIGLDAESELVAVKYDMTIEPYDPFVCMAVFPKSAFEAESEEATEEATEEVTEEATEEKTEAATEQAPQTSEEVKEETLEVPEETKEEVEEAPEVAEETKEEAVVETESKPAAEETEPTAEKQKEEPPAEEPAKEEPAKEEPAAEEPAAEEPVKEPEDQPVAETQATEETNDRPVTKVIEKMTQSPAVLPGEITGEFLTNIHAENVMRTDLAWANQDDTVESVLNKMQQQNTGYALIGSSTDIQGIVSKSDIQGALSPYLQSIFSKWKRELDTATLQIKVRWIMSRPVHTVRPDATLGAVMETICKHSVRALPVADENGVCGLVTAYTIFNALTSASSDDTAQQGQPTDVPALS